MGLESFLSCGGETRAGGPSVRASCSCLASLVVCVPEAGASQVTCWRSRTRTVTSTASEWGESYHPGGSHPVHLKAVFNGRYSVICKLGYGSFSTAWLAVDLQFVVSLCVFIALAFLTCFPPF